MVIQRVNWFLFCHLDVYDLISVKNISVIIFILIVRLTGIWDLAENKRVVKIYLRFELFCPMKINFIRYFIENCINFTSYCMLMNYFILSVSYAFLLFFVQYFCLFVIVIYISLQSSLLSVPKVFFTFYLFCLFLFAHIFLSIECNYVLL